MKKIKNLVSVVLICCLALTVSATAFAAPPVENAPTTRGVIAQCPSCGLSLWEYATQWSGVWVFLSERKCIETSYGTDLGERQEGSAVVKCVRCTYGYTKTYYQYRWSCRGYYN